MKQSQYQLIAGHPLRNIYRGAIQDARDYPKVSEVKAAIDEAVPGADQKVKDAILADVKKLMDVAQTRGREHWFDLRGQADLKVLAVLEAMEAAERMWTPQPTEEEALVAAAEGEFDPAAAAASILEGDDPTAKNARAIQEQHKQAELEANRLRQMGGTV